MTEPRTETWVMGTVEDVAAFVDEEYKPIWRLVYWELHDAELANDLTQETFARFLGWVRRNPGRPYHRGLLIRMAVNLCRDHRRSRRSAPAPADPALEQSGPASELETRWDIDRAIAELDEHSREVLILHYLLDLSVDEMARILTARPGAVRTRLTRAKARLALRLEGYRDAP